MIQQDPSGPVFPSGTWAGRHVRQADQARCRCHLTLPPGQRQPMRIEHEYHRHGALAYLAALDVHHANVRRSLSSWPSTADPQVRVSLPA